MKHLTIIAAMLAVSSCLSKRTIHDHTPGAVLKSGCETALTGCDGSSNVDLIGEVGHISKEQLDKLSRDFWAEHAQKQAEAQANLTFFQSYIAFVNTLDPKAAKEDVASMAPYGTREYWTDYKNKLAEFFRAEKEKSGTGGSPDFTLIMRELSDVVAKEAAATGQEVIVDKVTTEVVEGVTTTNGTTATIGSQTTLTSMFLPGQSIAHQQNTQHAVNTSIASKGQDLRIRMAVTYRTSDGSKYPQELVFQLGAEHEHVAENHAAYRAEAAQAKRDAEAKKAAQAARAAREQAIRDYLASLGTLVVEYVYSWVDQKFYTVTPEMKAAFNFIDYAWLGVAEAKGAEVDRAAKALNKVVGELRTSQKHTAEGLASVAALEAKTEMTQTEIDQARATLNLHANAACDQKTLDSYRRDLEGAVRSLHDTTVKAAGAIETLKLVQDVTPLVVLLQDQLQRLAAGEAALNDAAGVTPLVSQCNDVASLFNVLSLRAQSAAAGASVEAMRQILADLAVEIGEETARIKSRAASSAAVYEAYDLATALTEARNRDHLSDAVRAVGVMREKLTDLGLASADPARAALEKAVADWEAYTKTVKPSTILAMRAKPLRPAIAALRQNLVALTDPSVRDAVWNAWAETLAAEGVRIVGACQDPSTRFSESCWELNMPGPAATLEDLAAFDRRLASIEGAAEAVKKGLPTP